MPTHLPFMATGTHLLSPHAMSPRASLSTGSSADHRRSRLGVTTALLLRGSRRRGLTLVEVMVSLMLLAGVMVCFLAAFMQSRRMTEGSVLNAACTSLVYGL